MKEVQHHNGFIYFSKYKFSWAILNKNQIKNHKNLLFIKMTLFGRYHILAFFPPKPGHRLKIVLRRSLARFARGDQKLCAVQLSLFDQVHATPIECNISLMIASINTSSDIAFNILIAEFISMLWVIILYEYKFLTH